MTPTRLVIFDCDGVLVDSEPAARAVAVAEAHRLGWTVTDEDAESFTGRRWTDLQPVFERATGHALPADWPVHMQRLFLERVANGGLRPTEGAAEMLEATASAGLPYRIASNSSLEEMAVKFAATGLTPLVEGRLFSAFGAMRGKPAPDVFLAAAASACARPEQCIVLEDSLPGVQAARAAGMTCLVYLPGPDPHGLASLAMKVRRLADVPPILDRWAREKAA